MPFKMSLRKRAKKIPDSEIVVFYEGDMVVEKREVPEIVELMAREAISTKRKYESFIVERNIRENGRVIGLRVIMLLKPIKKEEKKKKK